jgi:hypothetical protein
VRDILLWMISTRLFFFCSSFEKISRSNRTSAHPA